MSFHPDPVADRKSLRFGDLKYPLLVNQHLADNLEDNKELSKRVSLILQHLGAHGKTTVTKGCSGENRGWRRSPLGGGSNGMKHYLWWAPKGSPPLKGFKNLEEKTIVVSSVRLHDDHSAMKVEEEKLDADYLPLSPVDVEEDPTLKLERPWTPEQLKFVDAETPVRIVVGLPGSGKTTVLWKAVEARQGENVLYLTWSEKLSDYARERFESFAPEGLRVRTLDFLTFLGRITGKDVERVTLRDSFDRFNEATRPMDSGFLGAWNVRRRALFSEIRAELLGKATLEDDRRSESGILRLSDSRYRELRGNGRGVGKIPAEDLLRVVKAIEGRDLGFSEIFPELVAATAAVEFLRNGKNDLSEDFLKYDRIVLDEAQDLTLLESEVIMELCRAIGERRKRAPWLLLAGDEGQTVRPSGFDWGKLKDLVTARLSKPEEFKLEENMRCPDRIAKVVEKAKRYYGDLNKDRRPTKQSRREGGIHVEANLLHLEIADEAEASVLLEKIGESESVAVISLEERIPAWAGEGVFAPAETKGLEYQSVCVLNPGSQLAELSRDDRTGNRSGHEEILEHSRRTKIDQLRVALSRATETLAFIDVAAKEDHLARSKELLGEHVPCDPSDLEQHFQKDERSVDDRVSAKIEEAGNLLEERPSQAWRKAYQAMRMLGRPDRPNGVSDGTLRVKALQTVRGIGVRLLVRGDDGFPLKEIRSGTSEAIAKLGIEDGRSDYADRAKKALNSLVAWTENRTLSDLVALLNGCLVLGNDAEWMIRSFRPVAQELMDDIERASSDSALASNFSGDVEGWFRLCEETGSKAKIKKLRVKAFDTLLDAKQVYQAALVLELIRPEDNLRIGKLMEARKRWEEAAKAFEKAKSVANAYRNWKRSGRWEEALRFAKGKEKANYEWLIEVEELLGERPEDLDEALSPKERLRLERILEDAR